MSTKILMVLPDKDKCVSKNFTWEIFLEKKEKLTNKKNFNILPIVTGRMF